MHEHLINLGTIIGVNDRQGPLAWKLDDLPSHNDRVVLAPLIVPQSVVVGPESVLNGSFTSLGQGLLPKKLNWDHSHLSDQSLYTDESLCAILKQGRHLTLLLDQLLIHSCEQVHEIADPSQMF